MRVGDTNDQLKTRLSLSISCACIVAKGLTGEALVFQILAIICVMT